MAQFHGRRGLGAAAWSPSSSGIDYGKRNQPWALRAHPRHRLRPRIGAYVVAAWLAAIIVNLVMTGGYFDVALRDFGLLLAALALRRLSSTAWSTRHERVAR